VTSNLPFQEWTEVLGSERLTGALLDRLTHHVHILEMNGESYRNLWRRLALPKRIEKWSLTSLQQRLVKTGGRLVKHARYYWLLLAESHLTRRLFGSMVRRIAVLSLPAG
jgi:hypothetical protein